MNGNQGISQAIQLMIFEVIHTPPSMTEGIPGITRRIWLRKGKNNVISRRRLSELQQKDIRNSAYDRTDSNSLESTPSCICENATPNWNHICERKQQWGKYKLVLQSEYERSIFTTMWAWYLHARKEKSVVRAVAVWRPKPRAPADCSSPAAPGATAPAPLPPLGRDLWIKLENTPLWFQVKMRRNQSLIRTQRQRQSGMWTKFRRKKSHLLE